MAQNQALCVVSKFVNPCFRLELIFLEIGFISLIWIRATLVFTDSIPSNRFHFGETKFMKLFVKIDVLNMEVELQKTENAKAPSAAMKALVEKLKKQLEEKDVKMKVSLD